MILFLAVAALGLSAWGVALACLRGRKLRAAVAREATRADVAIERLHSVSDSVLRGFPAVKWHRDIAAGLPAGADMWYWRIRIAGEDLLLTDEQYEVAKRRADFLLSSKP